MSRKTLAGGRYRLQRPLGQGGMALVYLARDAELDRQVAVKLLADNLAGDAGFRDRFLREARVAGRVSHQNVVSVYDAGEDGGRPYIVMEYVEGATLAEELARRGPLPVEEVVAVGVQACAALARAHAVGLVHRDVKPRNLLLRPDGVLKIADFGIARAAEETRLTEIGTVLGTAAYLSPEQAAGEDVTPAADVYSLGAVLYELLSGRTPFTFESLPELALKQRDGAIEPLRDVRSEIPEGLESVVMRCLARNPGYRPSLEEVAGELGAALSGRPTEALPTAPLPAAPGRGQTRARGDRPGGTRVWESPRLASGPVAYSAGLGRKPWVWALAVLLAAVVALALVLALASDGDSGSSQPAHPRVASIQRGATPATEARNIAGWVRRYSR